MPNLNELFTKWGKAQRQIPHNSEIIKQTTLSHMPIASDSRKKLTLPWFSLAFAGLAVLALIVQPFTADQQNTFSVAQNKSATVEVGQGVAEPMDASSMIAPDREYYRIMPPYYDGGVPITDDREFLKTDYQAEIRTRDTMDMARRVQTLVHAYDGRIDSLSSSEKYGYITFALPATEFDAFQAEINTLTRGKMITETINMQNLLPEVRRLEQQKKDTEVISDKIATVQGTISLRWISIPEIIELYVGPYWLPILFALLAIIGWFLNRRKTSRIVLPA